MPRFVILEHDHPARHWDFMLEAGATLRSWRLEQPPSAGQAVRAEASFAHRLLYLDFEGPLTGNRGAVTRWEAGTFACEKEEEDCLHVRIQGKHLRGLACLQHVSGMDWTLTWHED